MRNLWYLFIGDRRAFGTFASFRPVSMPYRVDADTMMFDGMAS